MRYLIYILFKRWFGIFNFLSEIMSSKIFVGQRNLSRGPKKACLKFFIFMVFPLSSFMVSPAVAGTFSFWSVGYQVSPRWQDPEKSCAYQASFFPYIKYNSNKNWYSTPEQYNCVSDNSSPAEFTYSGFVTISCPDDSYLSSFSSSCIKFSQANGPDSYSGCTVSSTGPSLFSGNPVNVTTGNKYETSQDIAQSPGSPIEFLRIYNSALRAWLHSYSSNLQFSNSSIILITDEGSAFNFSFIDSGYFPLPGIGVLKKTSSGYYFSRKNGIIDYYDTDGILIKRQDVLGRVVTLSRAFTNSKKITTVADEFGNSLEFSTDSANRLEWASLGSVFVKYSYPNVGAPISEAQWEYNGEFQRSRKYEYSNQDSWWLTKISDSSGVFLKKWEYDSYGRAISSEHSGGVERYEFDYSQAGITRVTNPLGKVTEYHYRPYGYAQRITQIVGEPSANCPLSNSTFDYDSSGQLIKMTDAKGAVTTYTYNDRGLETSRTEASGTPQARTTTTEWDPVRFLPTRIQDPARTTTYTYDDQGRELNRQVTAR